MFAEKRFPGRAYTMLIYYIYSLPHRLYFSCPVVVGSCTHVLYILLCRYYIYTNDIIALPAEKCTWSPRYIPVYLYKYIYIILTQRRPVTLSGYRNGIPLALYTDNIRIHDVYYICICIHASTTRISRAPNRDADTRGPPNIPIHGLHSNYIVVTVYCRRHRVPPPPPLPRPRAGSTTII